MIPVETLYLNKEGRGKVASSIMKVGGVVRHVDQAGVKGYGEQMEPSRGQEEMELGIRD